MHSVTGIVNGLSDVEYSAGNLTWNISGPLATSFSIMFDKKGWYPGVPSKVLWSSIDSQSIVDQREDDSGQLTRDIMAITYLRASGLYPGSQLDDPSIMPYNQAAWKWYSRLIAMLLSLRLMKDPDQASYANKQLL